MADRKQYMKEWRLINKEKLKEYNKNYRLKNKDYIKQYQLRNKEKLKEYKKQWYHDNKEHKKQYNKQWNIDNKEHRKQYHRENREHIRQRKKQHYQENKEYCNQYNKQKYKTDLKYNLNDRMSRAIRLSLKGNKAGRKWEDLVGYTVEDLKKRLESTLPAQCTWRGFLDGKLHIDHIIPKSVFNYSKPEHIDFKNCWSLSNLQLLSAEENLRKNAKLYEPFQPSFKMAI